MTYITHQVTEPAKRCGTCGTTVRAERAENGLGKGVKVMLVLFQVKDMHTATVRASCEKFTAQEYSRKVICFHFRN
jgi:hypothetical protein